MDKLTISILAVFMALFGGRFEYICQAEPIAVRQILKIFGESDIRTATCILYAESADDLEGWIPKLNTYWNMRKESETLLETMKRVSSAYRKGSKQYNIAKKIAWKSPRRKGRASYEEGVYFKMELVIRQFRPNPNWQYSHHESLGFYKNYQHMVKVLRKKWGNKVDFKNPLKIGKEYYFKEV